MQVSESTETASYELEGSLTPGRLQYDHIRGIGGYAGTWLHTHNVSCSCWTPATTARIVRDGCGDPAASPTRLAGTSWQKLPTWARIVVVIGALLTWAMPPILTPEQEVMEKTPQSTIPLICSCPLDLFMRCCFFTRLLFSNVYCSRMVHVEHLPRVNRLREGVFLRAGCLACCMIAIAVCKLRHQLCGASKLKTTSFNYPKFPWQTASAHSATCTTCPSHGQASHVTQVDTVATASSHLSYR